MRNRVKASIAAAALVAGGALGVPALQASTGVGAGIAEARPDPGQSYTRCYVFYQQQGGVWKAYKQCM